MAVRRLAPKEMQPETFAFSAENLEWANKLISRYPEGRQASAVIPLLWRAQEQNNGWVSEPAIRVIADMLSMPYIRVLEVVTFYTMFQLQPVGARAHIQVCGTTPCMLRGANELKKVCQNRIHHDPHHLSEDGQFSWEEVECLGSCVNAPMVQIFKDTYEDLDVESFEKLLDDISAGRAVTPGPQNGRHFSMPAGGATSLQAVGAGDAGVGPAAHVVDGQAKTSWVFAGVSINGVGGGAVVSAVADAPLAAEAPAFSHEQAAALAALPADASDEDKANAVGSRPAGLTVAREGKPDDLKRIKGIGKVNQNKLNALGIWHFDQIASWTRTEIDWVGTYLSFAGRIDREGWVSQAATLAAGGETEFSKRVDAGDVPSSSGNESEQKG